MNPTIHFTDVLVIGGGLAGIQCALALGEQGPKAPRVTLVDGGVVGASGASPRAKGGVAVPVDASDDPGLHARDTLSTGAGLCDHKAVHVTTEEGPPRLRDLLAIGVPFDRDDSGALALGQEAAHSRRRIVRAGGDSTGAAICETMTASLRRADHVTLREECRVVELITVAPEPGRAPSEQARVVGAWLQHADGRLEVALAEHTVLATGGTGQLFSRTSNPSEAFGSGLALAFRAGAWLVDLEFVQFHPTALDVSQTPLPLLSEAIRGEGAILVDEEGRRFMCEVHEDAELAPRDVVARAIWERNAAGETVFLDATHLGEEFYERFPAATADCQRAGFDPARDLLPVTPAAHYHMGGAAVNLHGHTSVPGLWACGEVASTGLHGANRLASNSLLEALVFGARVARAVSQTLADFAGRPRRLPKLDELDAPQTCEPADAAQIRDELRHTMWHHVGLTRDAAGLERALGRLDELASRCAPTSTTGEAVTLASLMTIAALRRTESRGAHFRQDHPRRSDDWQKRLVFTPDGVQTEALGAERDFCERAPKARRLPW